MAPVSFCAPRPFNSDAPHKLNFNIASIVIVFEPYLPETQFLLMKYRKKTLNKCHEYKVVIALQWVLLLAEHRKHFFYSCARYSNKQKLPEQALLSRFCF